MYPHDMGNVFGGVMNQHNVYEDMDPLTLEQRRQYLSHLRQFFEQIPLISPQKMFQLLTKYQYKGQEDARKAITLLAYRHVRRLKRIYLEGIPRDHLPPKTNYLMIGPTGNLNYLTSNQIQFILTKLGALNLNNIKEAKISKIADEQIEKEYGSTQNTSSALENQLSSAAFYLQSIGYNIHGHH